MLQPAAKMSRSFLGGIIAQESVAPNSPAMMDRMELERDSARFRDSVSKLDSTLVSLVEHVEKHTTLPIEIAQYVTDGKVLVQVWLNDTKPETLTILKERGFVIIVHPKAGHLVIGRLPVDQLESLTKLSVVRYIALQRSAA